MNKIHSWMLDRVLSSNKEDGWLIVQRGNSYSLEPADYDSDADAFVVEHNGDEQYYEDTAGLMHTMRGVPVGLATDEARPIVDTDTASTATTAEQKMTDGGLLSAETTLTVDEIVNRLKVGSVNTQYGQAHIINPFHALEDEPDVVDLRESVRLFPQESSPDTPRKAADNAVEAERATQGLSMGKVGDWVQIVGSFIMGAITVEFIAGSSGGGGVEVPIMLMPDMAFSILPALL